MIDPDSRPANSAEHNLNDLFSQYAILRDEKTRLDMELDRIDEEMKPIAEQIKALMVELEYQSINHDGIKYWLSVSGRPSIIPETRSEFMETLEEEGESGIRQTDYVNSNTMWGWWNNLSENLKEVFRPFIKISEEITLNSPRDYKRKRKKK